MKNVPSSYWWSRMLCNLGIIGLVAFGIWFTKSLWALLGLFFLFYYKADKVKTKCPKCQHEFVAVEEDEEDDEGDGEDEKKS